ncbi:60S ribosomal protein L31 [Cryptosporidium ryanae]|uniref:60S ribosomal protein L31 n=1 Tax=Cryptosporidium ryanae TaxID=515981 RepID=UPI00351A4740|nr:60S ribosomal protein L31 [Cryptosporidium ryanae]
MTQVKRNLLTPCTRDYTINLSKMVHKTTFKKRAPKAIKGIREFAGRVMKTEDVRIDAKLNKFIFSKGIRNLPARVRVRISRKRSESDDSKELKKYKTNVISQSRSVDIYLGSSENNTHNWVFSFSISIDVNFVN